MEVRSLDRNYKIIEVPGFLNFRNVMKNVEILVKTQKCLREIPAKSIIFCMTAKFNDRRFDGVGTDFSQAVSLTCLICKSLNHVSTEKILWLTHEDREDIKPDIDVICKLYAKRFQTIVQTTSSCMYWNSDGSIHQVPSFSCQALEVLNNILNDSRTWGDQSIPVSLKENDMTDVNIYCKQISEAMQ